MEKKICKGCKEPKKRGGKFLFCMKPSCQVLANTYRKYGTINPTLKKCMNCGDQLKNRRKIDKFCSKRECNLARNYYNRHGHLPIENRCMWCKKKIRASCNFCSDKDCATAASFYRFNGYLPDKLENFCISCGVKIPNGPKIKFCKRNKICRGEAKYYGKHGLMRPPRKKCQNCGDLLKLHDPRINFCNKPECRSASSFNSRKRRKEKTKNIYLPKETNLCNECGEPILNGRTDAMFCTRTNACISGAAFFRANGYVKKIPTCKYCPTKLNDRREIYCENLVCRNKYRRDKKKENPEKVKEYNKNRREKWKNDEEYRKKIKKYHNDRHRENMNDPVYRQKIREQSKARRAKIKKNPVLYKKERDDRKKRRGDKCICGKLKKKESKFCMTCTFSIMNGNGRWDDWDTMFCLTFFDKNRKVKKGRDVGSPFYKLWESLGLWRDISRIVRGIKKYQNKYTITKSCCLCKEKSFATDHLIHYEWDYNTERKLFIDIDRNLNPMCKTCHAKKSIGWDKIIKELGYTLQEFDYLTHQQRAEIMLDFATFLMDIMKQQIALKKTKKFISKALPLIFLRTNNPTQLTLGG